MNNQIKNIKDAAKFMLAGNSVFTVVSTKTLNRYTFKVKYFKENLFFVKFLSGNNNENDYTFIGSVINNKFKYSVKSKVKEDSTVVKTFTYLFNSLIENKEENFSKILFFHENRCGSCGKLLTTPFSVSVGYGTECINKYFNKEEIFQLKRNHNLELLSSITTSV